MRIPRFRLVMTTLVAAGAVFCGTIHAAKPERQGRPERKKAGSAAVAEWKGGSISVSQLEEHSISRIGMAMRHGNEITPEGLRLLLDELIGRKILEQEARTPEILSDPKFVASYELAAAQELADRYIRETMKDRFAVSDNEVASALPARTDVVRFKTVVVPTKEEAEEALKALRGGMAFDDAMEKYSTVKTAPGSFTDLRNTGDYLDEAGRNAIRSLSPGELSAVIPMKIGYGVALVLENRAMTQDERDALVKETRVQLFQKKVGQHFESLRKNAAISLNETELMLAAGEDFEFVASHRPVLTVAGKTVYFDDYIRTRDVHLRDALKVKSPNDLYNGYKVEFENLGIAMALAREVASETGKAEPSEDRKSRIQEKLLVRVLGEKLFDGIVARDEEVRKEYEANKKAFTVRKRWKVRRLTFTTPEEAKRFRKSITSPEAFYKELRSRETRDDRFQNTYFEWQDLDRLDEKTRKELEKTRKGKLSGVVSIAPNVNYVYFVDDVESNYLMPFEDVRITIKRAVIRRKQQAKLGEFVDGRKSEYKIRIHDDVVKTVADDMNRKRKKLSSGHGKEPGGTR